MEPGGDVLHVGPHCVLHRVAWLAFGPGNDGSNSFHDVRYMAGFFGVSHRRSNSATMLMPQHQQQGRTQMRDGIFDAADPCWKLFFS